MANASDFESDIFAGSSPAVPAKDNMDTTYYSQITGEPFVSTAVYPNRLQDKEKLERDTDLVESGSPSLFFYSTRGNLLAQGYVRIVYGDHGPYIEHVREQILWDAFKCVRTSVGFYDK